VSPVDSTGTVHLLRTTTWDDSTAEPVGVFATREVLREHIADLVVDQGQRVSAVVDELPYYGLGTSPVRPRFDVAEAGRALWDITGKASGTALRWDDAPEHYRDDVMATVRAILAAALGVPTADLSTVADF
jgi:hypothetical protein